MKLLIQIFQIITHMLLLVPVILQQATEVSEISLQ